MAALAAAAPRPSATGDAARVKSVAFAPDGTWLLSVSDDGTARVWGRAEADIFAARMGW